MFSKGSDYYTDLLEFCLKTDAIKDQLEIDRKITEGEKRMRLDEKERRIKAALALSDLTQLDNLLAGNLAEAPKQVLPLKKKDSSCLTEL